MFNAIKDHIHVAEVKIELTPPHVHRTNKAERSISTLANHFIATIAGKDPSCPAHIWNEFVEQSEITVINLLRESATNSSISAYEAVRGRFDFNAT